MKTLAKIFALALLFTAPVAFADTVDVFNFNQNRGDIGLSDLVKLGAVQFLISGYNGPGVAGDIWEKNEGATETGLGLAAQADHEIGHTNDFLQLDMTHLNALTSVKSVTLGLNSLQRGEDYDIWGSNTAGALGVLIAANQTAGSFTVPLNYDFISITAPLGDVTLSNVDVDIAPPQVEVAEPGTGLTLMLGGALLAGMIKLRKHA